MKTVVIGPRPAELDAVITRRHALGQDTHDEVWEGDYHMAPAAHQWHGYVQIRLLMALDAFITRSGLTAVLEFNLGDPTSFRVPDGGVVRELSNSVWVDTAAMVIEVVSPGDESWEKFEFYAAHGVDEVLIADPAERTISIFVRSGTAYDRTDRSQLLAVSAQELHDSIEWPGA